MFFNNLPAPCLPLETEERMTFRLFSENIKNPTFCRKAVRMADKRKKKGIKVTNLASQSHPKPKPVIE